MIHMKIDNDFKSLLPELTAEEYAGLERDIVKHGILSPIILWNDTIVDGHNRYAIAQAHRFPESAIPTRDIQFDGKAKAIEWIINHQKNRRNLTKSQLVDAWSVYEKQVAVEAKENQGTRTDISSNLNESVAPIRTAAEVAKKIGVSENTYRDMKLIKKHGTADQIERMDKGGKGNGVSKIANEIRNKDVSSFKCNRCGNVYPAESFRKRKKICKYCLDRERVSKKPLYDVLGKPIQATGEFDNIEDSAITKNVYVNDVESKITINDVIAEFEVNLETYLQALDSSLNTHSDIVFNHKEDISRMWDRAVASIRKLREKYT